MSETRSDADGTRDVQAALAAPPMSPALQAVIAQTKPVRTRVPALTFAALLVISLAAVAAIGVSSGLRPDAATLPLAWLLATGAIWCAAGPYLLARAVLPAAGTVLPDTNRAGRSALVVAAGLVLLGLFGSGPVQARPAANFGADLVHCSRTALWITVPVLLAGALLLRRLHPIGADKIGAAIGAAGGAWAGVTLHMICPYGGGMHIGLAHGGAAVVGAVLGAVLGWLSARPTTPVPRQ